MRTSDHFKIPKEQRADYGSYKPSLEEVIKKPLITPIHEVKNQNKLIDSAMLYFSNPVHRDHGFYPDPRIPYEAYLASETEKREKVHFGENQTIVFDINEEVEKIIMRERELESRNSQRNIKTKSILKNNPKTVVPYRAHANPYIDACQELMIKCYNMCGISADYLDIDKMFDSLGKLMFGISNEFKMKELCFNYVLAAERRKWFEEQEDLRALLEEAKIQKLELSTKLEQETGKVEDLQKFVTRIEQLESVQQENTGLTLVNSDLTSFNGQLTINLANAEARVFQLEEVEKTNVELNKKISDLTLENRNLNDDHNRIFKEKQELESKNSQLLANNTEHKSEREKLIERNELLVKDNTDFISKIEEKNNKINFLETQIKNFKSKYDRDTKSDMKYFKNKINDMLKENLNQTSQLDQIKSSLHQANGRIDELLKDNESLRMHNDKLHTDLQEKLKDVKHLQLQLEQDKLTFTKYEKLENEKQLCNKALVHLRQEYAILQENSQNLAKAHIQLDDQNRDLIQYRKSTHDALNELSGENDKLRGIIVNLQNDKQEKENQIEDLKLQLKCSIKTIELLEKSNLKFQKKPQELEDKIQLLQHKNERLNKRYKVRETEIQQAKQNMRQMTNSLYNARMTALDHENICSPADCNGLVSNSAKVSPRKRDMLRSLANRRSVIVTEPSHNSHKNVY